MKHLCALLLLFSLSLTAQVAVDTTTLDNVEVTTLKQSKKITIGNGTRKKAALSPFTTDWSMLGKLFPYKESYTATPFLKNVELFTRNKSNATAQFRLHLYKMGKDSLPAEELVAGGIMASAKRGKKETVVDVTAYNLSMPAEGLIVAYEWLKFDSNLYPYEATGKIVDTEIVIAKKTERVLVHGPDIYSNDMPQPISYYFKGYWHKFQMNQWSRHNGNWMVPAINVTLSN
ncbi:hypothetical protein AM493_14445 [Flavobacterium akiainvivens]|uniref:Uncharacterized protein n=1 Tax=Flavobacterium akiainvivens TaxID=1202724 RepID=A0A0M9VIV8_9FLAO|nr:hypothetical protein [Flavobacterium akiainvivens]KOS07102.1 hypothetical protein AM493_14445 [Flavobacterium akiainvivens]SFQ75647.1 hypothetical protein SAMN05444144_12219 [Flavobacterium akiainvivens]